MQWITRNGKHIPIYNKQIKLGKKELNKVHHEINTWRKVGDEGKHHIKFIGNYAYVYLDNGFDNYSFYRKIKIVGNEKKLKLLQEYLRSGTLYGFF